LKAKRKDRRIHLSCATYVLIISPFLHRNTQGVPVIEALFTGIAMQHWAVHDNGKEFVSWFVGSPLRHHF